MVRVSDGEVTSWRNAVHGGHALAVSDTQVAIFGGYRGEGDRLAIGTLTADGFDVIGQYRVILPGGGAIPRGTRVVGRGPDLHFLTPTAWYKLTLKD